MHLATRLAALSLATVLAGAVGAQTTTPDAGNAANSTGTSTSQQEMNRGVPGVDVDVGRNAKGAVDVDVDRNTNVRNAPGMRNGSPADTSSGTAGADGMRAPRSDRN